MAYLYRLIALVGLVFLLTPSAQASFPATQTNPTACTVEPCYQWRVGAANWSYTSPWFSSKPLACADYDTHLRAVTPSSSGSAVHADPYCDLYWNGAFSSHYTFVYQGVAAVPATYSCPANSTLSGSICTCDATYTEDGSSCVPPAPVNDCAQHAGGDAGDYTGLGSVGLKTVCVQDSITTDSGDPAQRGCVLTGTADFAAGDPPRWVARMSWTGGKCAPGSYDPGGTDPTVPNTPEEPDSTTCSPPKIPGTVNGQTVCVDAGPSDPKQQTSTSSGTETKPDGTTVGTGTTSSTECTPTTCTTTTTTTTTTTPPGGSPTSETTTTTGTCSRASPGCGEEAGEDEPSSFGGTCGAAFACDGDAIMCAVALEQHKRNCALFVDSSAESDLYNSEKGKTGPQYENENVALGTGAFNQSNALGAGAQCIQDRNITVMGNAITLPFSIICSTLQHFGTILIFISFLMAYRIVSRG